MSQFQNYFSYHIFGFWVGLVVAMIILAAWLFSSNSRQQRTRSHLDSILAEVEGGNVPVLLNEYLKTVRAVALTTQEMEHRVTYLYESLPSLVCHMGLVRFSPFHDTGGDLSFSMAMLDAKGDGIVISALHSRTDHKLYAKPVLNRGSIYALTAEEKRAINETVSLQVESTQ